MNIAVCSSDGQEVDLHFGKTTSFRIYSISGGEKVLKEIREVEAYSPSEEFLKQNGTDHPFSERKFEQAYEAIKDCRKIYTLDIGEKPAALLREKGIEVQLCDCPVDMIPNCSGNCKSK